MIVECFIPVALPVYIFIDSNFVKSGFPSACSPKTTRSKNRKPNHGQAARSVNIFIKCLVLPILSKALS